MSEGLPEKSDEELMVLYQTGSEAAFNLLYRRHSSKVNGYLRRRLRDPQVANDVLQGVFIKLHRSRHLFNASFAFSPWLFTIARTVLLDHLKHMKTEEIIDGSAPIPESTSVDNPSSGSRAIPELTDLPEAQRSALELRYYQGLSFEEIAAKLDTTPGNVRQLVSRGIRQLRALMQGKGG